MVRFAEFVDEVGSRLVERLELERLRLVPPPHGALEGGAVSGKPGESKGRRVCLAPCRGGRRSGKEEPLPRECHSSGLTGTPLRRRCAMDPASGGARGGAVERLLVGGVCASSTR